MGALNYFLGVELVQTTTVILLSQHSYICDLLQRFGMCDAKAVGIPLSSSVTLQLNDGAPLADSTLYRQLIGALQYLTLTQPDISFVVNKLSQFMRQP